MGKNRRHRPGRGAVRGMHCASGTRCTSSRLLALPTSNRKDPSPIRKSPTPPQSPAPPCLLGGRSNCITACGPATTANKNERPTNQTTPKHSTNQTTPKCKSPIIPHAPSRLHALSRRSSRLWGENEQNYELLVLSPPQIRKRVSLNQKPTHLSPSQARPKTKTKKATTIIKDISISNVILMRPQNKGGSNPIIGDHQQEVTSEWCKCAYVITIDNGKCGASGDGCIKVWVDKNAWLSDDPALTMMHKARSAIHGKAKEHGLELRSGFASFAMRYTWPWKMLWESFMHHVNWKQ